MATEALRYRGFLETESYGNPSLIQAETPEARKRASRENTGGLVFVNESEMLSLKELLARGEIKSAVVIDSPPPFVDQSIVDANPGAEPGHEGIRRQLKRNLEMLSSGGAMDEDYVFLAAFSDEALDDFLRRAEALLDRAEPVSVMWDAFVEREGVLADRSLIHEPIQFRSVTRVSPEREWEPLISLESLGVNFTRGAIGGPRALVDIAEA